MKIKRQYIQKKFDRENLLNKYFATPGLLPLILVLDHLKPNFNVGKILRTAEFFSLKAVYLINIPFFDPLPAKGAVRKIPIKHFANFNECLQNLKDEEYHLYSFELSATRKLGQINFPKKSAFILGNEEFGVSFKNKDYPEITPLIIPRLGVTESLNVAVAAGITCFEYVRQVEPKSENTITN